MILLQSDLNRILNWAQENNMEMNEDKFELMRYGPLQNIKQNTSYQAHQQTINSNEFVRNLGINMSGDATFTHHINSITQTARKLAGWILRTFQTRTKSYMLILWKALGLPRIEYCCQLWSPHRRGEIIKLEAVQRSFTSRISSVQYLNYWERLKALSLYSLQRRRERYTIIYVWKTLEGIVLNVGIQVNEHPRRGRLCYVKRTETISQRIGSIVYNSFAMNGTRLFNAVPKAIRDLSGVTSDQFKHQLDRWLAAVPDEPPTPGYPSITSNSIINLWRAEEVELPGRSRGPP